MKKYIILGLGILLIAIILILTQIPTSDVNAESNTSDFDVQGSTMLKYTGSGNTVQIPNTIKIIGAEAFKGNKQISSITIPANITTIEQGAFYGCSNLEQVIIENGVKNIGGSAFCSCNKLKRVVIPGSVSEVKNGAFSDCTSLGVLEIADSNESLFLNDGVLYNRESTELIQYLAGRTKDSYTIPFTVEKVRPYAFWGVENLKSMEIGNGMKKISSYAFTNCVGLEKVFIPNSITKIEAYAFSDCINLKEADMENPVVNIHETAFQNSSSEIDINMNATKGENESANTSAGSNTVSVNSVEAEKENIATLKKKPYTGIDMTSPNGLLGASKIVGGNAFIIMENGKTVSDTNIED